jgi:hypothetical protein
VFFSISKAQARGILLFSKAQHAQPMSTPIQNTKPQQHDILFHPTHTVVERLEIEDVIEGSRDKQHVLTDGGGVLFRNEKRKLWFVPFTEFSFIFNRAPALS